VKLAVRSKSALLARFLGVDPVGRSLVAMVRRVNAVNEPKSATGKIDIIVWKKTPMSTSPKHLAQLKYYEFRFDEAAKHAKVIVAEDQLSIAIGRGGQNVRLASKLVVTNWNIESEKQPER